MSKPFNIEAAKAGKKVTTRDGREVEILKFDLKSNYPLGVVITEEDGVQWLNEYTEEGLFSFDVRGDSPNNLVMATEITTYWVNVYEKDGRKYTAPTLHSTKEAALAEYVNIDIKWIATVSIEIEE